MPASLDPRNTFEVTVPPLFGQGQSVSFTFRPTCPGPVTVRISMGPGLAIPVTCAPIQEPSTPTRVSFGVSPMSLRPITPPSVSLAHAPNRKPSTPMRVSAGVLPIPIQRTPPRTLVSRGVSPIPLEDLIPTEFASIFYTQLQTQVPGIVTLPALPTSPTHSPAWLNVISATESETEEERPLIQARNRAHSPEIVPDSQLLRREAWLRREAYMLAPTPWETSKPKRRKV